MKELKLSVKDRLLLLQMLPNSGGRIEMMLVKSLSEELDFTPEEVSAFELKDVGNGAITGDPKKFRDKVIVLSNEQSAILKPLPERLDMEKKVTTEILPLLDLIDSL